MTTSPTSNSSNSSSTASSATSSATLEPAEQTAPLAVTSGMRHVALNVHNLDECLEFYTNRLGMAIEWQPDSDNVFLCSGNDNLALHRRFDAPKPTVEGETRDRLDHIGFIIDNINDIDAWHQKLVAAGVNIAQPPKTHRDGARSFYCYDPDGTLVQLIYHPPISGGASSLL